MRFTSLRVLHHRTHLSATCRPPYFRWSTEQNAQRQLSRPFLRYTVWLRETSPDLGAGLAASGVLEIRGEPFQKLSLASRWTPGSPRSEAHPSFPGCAFATRTSSTYRASSRSTIWRKALRGHNPSSSTPADVGCRHRVGVAVPNPYLPSVPELLRSPLREPGAVGVACRSASEGTWLPLHTHYPNPRVLQWRSGWAVLEWVALVG